MAEREEIIEVRTNSPKSIAEEEMKEIWTTENPNRSPGDFNSQDPSQKQWIKETQARFEDFSARWGVERSQLPVLQQVDQKIGSSLEPANNPTARATYKELIDRFGDDATSPFSRTYTLPNEAQGDWKQLVKA